MMFINILIFLFYLLYPFQEEAVFGIQYIKPYYLIFLLLASILFILTLNRKTLKFCISHFYFLYFPFLIWAQLSVLWSVKYSDSIYACSKYLIYILIGISVTYYLIITKNYKKILTAIYFSALIISAMYLYTFIKKGGFLFFTGQATMSTIAQIASINVGFGGGRNLLASWLSLALTFSFPILINKSKNNLWKILLTLSSLFLLFIIFLTLSRTAILAIFVCITILAFLTKDKKLKKAILFIVFLTLIATTIIIETNFLNLGNFLIKRFTLSIESIEGNAVDYGTLGRLKLWHYGLQSFLTSPISGSGIGTLYKGISEIGGVHNYHNIFIQFLAQTGLIGLLLFTIWTIWLFFASYLNVKYFRYTNFSFLANLTFANIITYYFKSLLMFQYFDLEIWTLIGFTAALYCYRKKFYQEKER